MPVDPPVDAYTLLGVSPDADDRELRHAYRRAARSAHPDAGAPVAAFRALQAAWEQVRTPERRAAYDARGQIAAPVLRAARPVLTARPPDGWPASMIDRRSGVDRRGVPRGPDRRRPVKRFARPTAKIPARFARFDAGAPEGGPRVDMRG
jgi:curved DNA-binding protein CbpA